MTAPDEVERLARALKNAFAGSYIVIHDADFLIASDRLLTAGYSRTAETLERARQIAIDAAIEAQDAIGLANVRSEIQDAKADAAHVIAGRIAAAIRAGKRDEP